MRFVTTGFSLELTSGLLTQNANANEMRLIDVKDENPHVKMREHLQVIAKECSKPIAKFIQVDTEVQKVYLAV